MDKRIQKNERGKDGACPSCGRRHQHRDSCGILRQRPAKTEYQRGYDAGYSKGYTKGWNDGEVSTMRYPRGEGG